MGGSLNPMSAHRITRHCPAQSTTSGGQPAALSGGEPAVHLTPVSAVTATVRNII
jgi:hypothetical protein